jgi:alpha-L-rhamnosidase
MNSFNHYAFGAVGAWMYSYSLGIRRDEKSPGFKHFFLQPEPDPTGKMTYAKGHYDSMYGRIESSWETTHSAVIYRFAVPSNTSATLVLKGKSLKDFNFNNKSLKRSKGVKLIKQEGSHFVFEVQPGTYQILVQQ